MNEIPIDVIIPTRSPSNVLLPLVDQIAATATYPHRIVYTGRSGSAAFNRNYGLRQTQGERVVMVDDDIEFPSESVGWLRVLVEALQRPEVVMVSAQLFNPDKQFAYMTGLQDCGSLPRREGETVVPSRRLLTACCGFKPCGLRFDEGYVGSGFEDVDYSNQLAQKCPDGIFLICHRAWAVHRNEAKNQRGSNWLLNEARYIRKWGKEAMQPTSSV